MLNNGKHYLVEFSDIIAIEIGISSKGSLWPSQIDDINKSGKIWWYADKVYAVEVEGNRIRSVYIVKNKGVNKVLHLDIDDWKVYDHDDFKVKMEKYWNKKWT